MHPNDRKILKRALASLPPIRRASLESVLLEDADPASKNQNVPDHYYGLPPKGIQASGKPVRLTPKEIARADYEIPDKPFTIVVRPQADGTYWVAAIDLNTGHPLLGWNNPNLGQMYVESKMEIPSAVRSVGRDLHKFTGYKTNMTDQMRHEHFRG